MRKYRQLYFDGGDIYYLIPELVRDRDCMPLCEKCCEAPRDNPFIVTNGHDYSRVENLPELSSFALDYIAPVRCCGMNISISRKHPSGHTICFPSNGPSKVACVLPRVDPDCMPRVTVIGPEKWRVEWKKVSSYVFDSCGCCL